MKLKKKKREEEFKIKLKEQALKDEIKIRKTKNKRYQIIFKKRTSIIKNRTGRKTKTIFKTIKIRKTN